MAAGYFFTGEQDLTPEGLDRKRALLNALRKDNLSAAPVGHWTQALSRVVGSAADSMEEAQLNRTEKAGTEKAKAELMRVLGLGGAVSPSEPTAAAGVPASAPAAATTANNAAPVNSSEIGGRLSADLQRDFGLKPEQAAGVVGNLAHESGNFRTLQEIKPTVPGSRGGYGYAQWTGPRRFAFEQFAHERGLDPTSYEANYGFLKHELQNTGEGKVLAALRQAGDVNSATQVFSDQFLRPGVPAMDSRLRFASQYAGSGQSAAPALTAALGNGQPVNVPPGAPPGTPKIVANNAAPVQSDAPAPGASAAQFNVPGQVPAAAPAPNAQALMAALSNPWAARSPMLAQLAASVAGKQLGRDPVEDALKRVQLQQAVRDLQESKPFEIIDPNTGEKITVVRDAQGNTRRIQLAGDPATPPKQTFKLSDGREVELPSNPEARKKFLQEMGTSSAKAVEGAPQAVQTANISINVLDQLAAHPGLPNLFGVYGKLPTMPGGPTADAEALLAQIKDRSFLQGIEAMRGTGAITEAEGAKATGAIARLSTNQSPAAFKQSLMELRGILDAARQRNMLIANNGQPPAQASQPQTPQPNAPVTMNGWTIERIN